MGMDLGLRIATWRAARGMSQGALARAVGVTRAAVSQWECDDADERTAPSHANLERVIAALGLTMVEFYGPTPKLKKRAS